MIITTYVKIPDEENCLLCNFIQQQEFNFVKCILFQQMWRYDVKDLNTHRKIKPNYYCMKERHKEGKFGNPQAELKTNEDRIDFIMTSEEENQFGCTCGGPCDGTMCNPEQEK